jgi:hypothetical protein
LPRIDSFDPDANVNAESSPQLEKQKSEIVSTDEGMQIDRSDEQLANAEWPRTESLQPNWNVKFDRFLQWVKHSSEMLSIEQGMQID